LIHGHVDEEKAKGEDTSECKDLKGGFHGSIIGLLSAGPEDSF
jgi:hypothetical protein